MQTDDNLEIPSKEVKEPEESEVKMSSDAADNFASSKADDTPAESVQVFFLHTASVL